MDTNEKQKEKVVPVGNCVDYEEPDALDTEISVVFDLIAVSTLLSDPLSSSIFELNLIFYIEATFNSDILWRLPLLSALSCIHASISTGHN